jgi:hypothetical protein
MHITRLHVAVGGVIAFWLGLLFFLSGGRIRQLFTITVTILVLLSLPSQALASCTDSLEHTADGRTVLCRTCCSSGSCIKTCF